MFDKQWLISKLTSRKFWAAITGFVTAVMFAYKVDEPTMEQVVALIGAISTLIAYIIGEGLVDSARESGPIYLPEDSQ